MDSNLVVIQGGWGTLVERFGPTIDTAYEQDLKRCRAGRHKKLISFDVDGTEVLVCTLCVKRFQETDYVR